MPLRSPIFAPQGEGEPQKTDPPTQPGGSTPSAVVTRPLLIGIVGPCAAGKSTLASALREHGYQVHHIAQEHSYVADMWKRITNPDLLIFLDVSYPLTLARRQMNWSEAEYAEQHHRLRHARQHANLFIDTDPLSPADVLQKVLDFLAAL